MDTLLYHKLFFRWINNNRVSTLQLYNQKIKNGILFQSSSHSVLDLNTIGDQFTEEHQILQIVKFDARTIFRFIAIVFIVILVCTTVLQSVAGMPVGHLSSSQSHNITAAYDHSILYQEDPSHLDTFTIYAPQLRDTNRTIQVYLPPDYFTSDKRYPVIYLQDGGMLFSTSDRDVHYDKTLDQLFYSGAIDGVIAVGIPASSSNRWDEYSPWVNSTLRLWTNSWDRGGGEGNNYLDFIVNTLKPYIDTNYRTLPDRDNTGIGGFSMGALISIYAGLSRPEVFSKVMATSPAVWFAEIYGKWLSNNQLLNYIASIDVPKNVMFYIDIGTNEWADNIVTAYDTYNNLLKYPYIWQTGAETLYNYLRTMQVPESNLMLIVEEGGIHDVQSWGGRFGNAIIWLYGKKTQQTSTPTTEPTKLAINTMEPTIISLEPTRISETAIAPNVREDALTAQKEFLPADNGDQNSNAKLIFGGILLVIVGIGGYWLSRKIFLSNK